MSGVALKALSVEAADGFHLPAEAALRAAVTPRTKAILVCSPNNPTGTVLRREELEAVGRIAEELGLFVIGDEVYREFVYEGEHTSVLSIPSLERRAILVDSVSKRYSACGARIGCLVSRSRDVVAAAIRMAQGRLCPPLLEQRGALAAARLGPDFFTPVREEYRRRRDAAFDGLAAIPGVTCLKPAGAFYLMADLPVADAESFTRWLLTDFEKGGETVMLAAGPGFYATPGRGLRQVRLAYVLEVPRIQRAMACLAEAVEAFAAVRAG
jgi:aspartate aminotransferase